MPSPPPGRPHPRPLFLPCREKDRGNTCDVASATIKIRSEADKGVNPPADEKTRGESYQVRPDGRQREKVRTLGGGREDGSSAISWV
ncbi:hypothetical protein BHE74_00003568 [Ensete ventricosum]|nr:hypothetical protein GW17_00052725 [Ensete ventricosum]RWW87596.1 hypothetical protein BHE74_00003568 [Ensete ventricosum]RZR96771.1 hypothetical protein BHM03_00025834 [Ensete ventricosum]